MEKNQIEETKYEDLRQLARDILYPGLKPAYKQDEKIVSCLTRALRRCKQLIEQE